MINIDEIHPQRPMAGPIVTSGVDPCLKICVTECGYPLVGASAVVNCPPSGPSGCVTDSAGCCDAGISGNCTITIVDSGVIIYNSTGIIVPIGTKNIGILDVICGCGSSGLPDSFTATDAFATFPMKHSPYFGHPTWLGCVTPTQLSSTVQILDGICTVNPPAEQAMLVCYALTCYGGNPPQFQVQRSWSWVYQAGTVVPIWYSASNTGFPSCAAGITNPCATSPPASCGSPTPDTAVGSGTASSLLPFYLSLSLTPTAGNGTKDPIGGGIVISS